MSLKVSEFLDTESFWGVVMLLVVGFSLSCSFYFAENVPLLDDYGLCFQFLDRYNAAVSWWDTLFLIFHFKNGHPTVVQNLMFVLDKQVFGEVNFQHFIYLNNLAHVALIFVFLKLFRHFSDRLFLFAPILLLITVPVFALNNWSSSFMHISTLVFALGSIALLAKPGSANFLWAAILAVLACLSSASGLLVFIATIPILIKFHSKKAQISWTVLGVLVCLWYILNYVFFADPETVNFSKEVSLFTYLVNFVVFFGTAFKPLYTDHYIWGAIFGLSVLSGVALVLVTRYKDLWNQPVLLSGIIYFLLLAFATTLARSQFGIGATTAYRYRFYHMIPLVFLYLTYLAYYQGKEYRGLIAIFSLSFLLYGFSMEDSWHELRTRSIQLRNGMLVYQVTGDPSQLTNRNSVQAERDIALAEALNIYHPEDNKHLHPSIEKAMEYSSEMTVIYDQKVMTDDYFYVQGWSFLNANSISGAEIRIGIKANGLLYHYPTSARVSPDDPLPMSRHSFSFVLPLTQVTLPAEIEEVCVLIWHPLQGVLASASVDFK